MLGDTWIWNGSAWDRRDVPGPPARYGHAMAYDGTGIVLFGGYRRLQDDLGDTWTWNGTTWAQASRTSTESAGARAVGSGPYGHGLQRRGARQPATIMPCSSVAARSSTAGPSSWATPGAGTRRTRKWAEHEPRGSPQARAHAQMAYRPGSGVVLHGGWNGATGQPDRC